MQPSHEAYGSKYFKAHIALKRDDFCIIIHEHVAESISEDEFYEVLGILRNYGKKIGHLDPARIFVTAAGVPSQKDEINSVEMIGEIRRLIPRTEHTEGFLSVPRTTGNYDVVPFAAWGAVSETLRGMLGRTVHIVGSLRGRRSDIETEDGEVNERVIYEVQITKVEDFTDEAEEDHAPGLQGS